MSRGRSCRSVCTELRTCESEENQKIFSSKLVKPTYVIITNSYIDHICEIGEDRKTTMWALSNSVSKDSIIIATDAEYQELGNEFYLVNDSYQEVSELPVNRQSLNIGYTLLKLFGINKESYIFASSPSWRIRSRNL